MSIGGAALPGGAVRRSLPAFLRPAWPDEARRVVQEPIFRELMGATPRGRFLNAGSGADGPLSGFVESFPHITEIVNIDIKPVRISDRRSDLRNRDVVGSITEMPFADRSFDWVLCTEVIEHVDDDRRAAGEIARVLKADGYALISVPTPPVPHENPLHEREGYTLEELGALLGESGLEVVAHRYCLHLAMRCQNTLWHWQRARLGNGGRRNAMPRFVMMSLAQLDRMLPLGRPYHLVVLARRG
jgi:SAM-dependent methyltransferase